MIEKEILLVFKNRVVNFLKRRIIILSYRYAGRYSIDRSDCVGLERRQRALNVRGERVGHEIARSVRVRVGGHTVVFLHLLAHGIERLGGDQAALLVNLPSDLVRRARIDVVVAATGRGSRVHGDFARGEGSRATRGARERREDAVHEAGAAREIVRVRDASSDRSPLSTSPPILFNGPIRMQRWSRGRAPPPAFSDDRSDNCWKKRRFRSPRRDGGR